MPCGSDVVRCRAMDAIIALTAVAVFLFLPTSIGPVHDASAIELPATTHAPPRLVRSEPADGATDVATDIGVLRFHFDQGMKQNQWSLIESESGAFPPLIEGDEATTWTSISSFELRIQALAPKTTYAVQLNSDHRQGFRSAWQNEPLQPTVITFTTGTGASGSQDATTQPAGNAFFGAPPDAQQMFGGGSKHAMFGDVPGLEINTPPPSWIKPGMRLTYYTMSAQLSKGPHEYILDEKGRWQDKDGNRYTRKNAVQAASHGYSQFHLAALDEKLAAVQLKFFSFEGMDKSQCYEALNMGSIVSTHTGGELWIHPDALIELARQNVQPMPYDPGSSGIWITPTRHTIDKATYNVLQIIAMTSDVRGVWMYDMESGLMIYSSSVTKFEGETTERGVETKPSGSMVTFSEYRGTRQTNIPWANGAAPSWVESIEFTRYQGNFNVEGQGMTPTPVPVTVEGKARRRGPGMLQMMVTTTIHAPGVPPAPAPHVYASNLIGGLWIPPEKMGELTPGQILDRDDYTEVTAKVARIDPQWVVIHVSAPRGEGELTYARDSGILTRMNVLSVISEYTGISNRIELQLTETK